MAMSKSYEMTDLLNEDYGTVAATASNFSGRSSSVRPAFVAAISAGLAGVGVMMEGEFNTAGVFGTALGAVVASGVTSAFDLSSESAFALGMTSGTACCIKMQERNEKQEGSDLPLPMSDLFLSTEVLGL